MQLASGSPPRFPFGPLSLRRRMLVLALLSLASCAQESASWQSSRLADFKMASPNQGERRPSLIVIHHTSESNFAAALKTLTSPDQQVSAHYLIASDGRIAQLVDERRRAWHAGVSRWGPIADVNSVSIGIELDNDGTSTFAATQVDALIALLHDLITRYAIDPRNVVAHGDVAPGRKDDPSVLFPWSRLAAAGIGLWCNAPPAGASATEEGDALREIGYQAGSAAEVQAARVAFRRHFLALESAEPLTSYESAVLACIAHQQSALPIH